MKKWEKINHKYLRKFIKYYVISPIAFKALKNKHFMGTQVKDDNNTTYKTLKLYNH